MDMKKYFLLIMIFWFFSFDSYRTPNIGKDIEFSWKEAAFRAVKLKDKIRVGSVIKLRKDKENKVYLSLRCKSNYINTDYLVSEKINDEKTVFHIDYGVCVIKNKEDTNLYITLSGGMDFLFLKNLKYCIYNLGDIGINEIFKGDFCEVNSIKGLVSVYILQDEDYEQLRLYWLTYGGVLNYYDYMISPYGYIVGIVNKMWSWRDSGWETYEPLQCER